jgi:hypothetical protein
MSIPSVNTNVPIGVTPCSLYIGSDIFQLFADLNAVKKSWWHVSLMSVSETFPLYGIPSCTVALPVGTCVNDPSGKQTGRLYKTTMNANLDYDFLPCIVVKQSCNLRELNAKNMRDEQIIFRGVLQSESVNIATQRVWQNTLTIHHWATLLSASQISCTFMNSISAGAPSQYALGIMFSMNSVPDSADSSGSSSAPSCGSFAMKRWIEGGQMNQHGIEQLGYTHGVDAMIIQILRNLAYEKSQSWYDMFRWADGRSAAELQQRANTAQKVVQMLTDKLKQSAQTLPTHVPAKGRYVTGAAGKKSLPHLLDQIVSIVQSNRFAMNYWELLKKCAAQANLEIICTVNDVTLEPCTSHKIFKKENIITGILQAHKIQTHSRPVIGAQMILRAGERVKSMTDVPADDKVVIPTTRTDYKNLMASVNMSGMYLPPKATTSSYNSFGSVAYFPAPTWIEFPNDRRTSFAYPKYKDKKVGDVTHTVPSGADEDIKALSTDQQLSMQIASALAKQAYWSTVLSLRKLSITIPLTLSFCPAEQVIIRLDSDIIGIVASVQHILNSPNLQTATKLTLTHIVKLTNIPQDAIIGRHPIYDASDPFTGRHLLTE